MSIPTTKTFISVLAAAIFTGCVREAETPLGQKSLYQVVFHAGWASETKTVLQEDGSVWWEPGDEIALFVKNQGSYGEGYKLTSTNKEAAATANFVGQIGSLQTTPSYFAVYPYSQEIGVDSEKNCFVVPVPSVQEACQGTFNKNLFISVAVSDNDQLSFRNVCGGIKFSVANDGINKVVIETFSDNEFVSGELEISQSAGEFLFRGGDNKLDIIAPNGGTFVPGAYYYAVLPAQTYHGLKISYYKEETIAVFKETSDVTINKSTFKRLYNKDAELSFVKVPNSKALLSVPILPDGVNKAAITEVNFYVNSDKVTETTIGNAVEGYEPVYFEQNGTVVNYYTKGEVFEFDSCFEVFKGWKSLKSLDLSTVNTSNAISMAGMFAECRQLNSIVLGEIVTDNVESMSEMFAHCMALQSVDLTRFNTSRVTNMAWMFAGCTNLKTLDVSSFDTSNVENMKNMFGPPEYESPIDFSGGDGCCALTELDLSGFNTSKVKNFMETFAGCVSLERLNLSGWDTQNAENINMMFQNCASLRHVDLSSFDTRNVTNAVFVFAWCTSLEELNLSNFSTPNLEFAQAMFYACNSLRKLDISHFSSEHLTSAPLMFAGCQQLTTLDLGDCDYSIVAGCESFLNAVAYKSNAVAIRCNDATRLFVENEYSDPTFDLEKVTWIGLNESLPDVPDIQNPELYYSTDYSMDKHVRVCQKATVGKGIDIVLLGDAYSDRLIADGTYDNDMNIAIDALFSYEPMKSFREYFNIYVVYAVSQNESSLGNTAVEICASVGTSINCQKYSKCAVSDKPMSDVATIIIGHDRDAFGYDAPGAVWSSFSYSDDDHIDYGQSQISLAFIWRDDNEEQYRGTIVHEFGHLFAKLWDEYALYNEAVPDFEIDVIKKLYTHLGAGKNIDLTNDLTKIRWKHFISDARYTNECLGAYEGGYTYVYGAWRPTVYSIMNNTVLKRGFNAPSREAIYNRIHKLAYGNDWQYDYETFVQQDLKNISSEPQTQSLVKSVPYPARVPQRHLFKMENSTAADGRKTVTIIMN